MTALFDVPSPHSRPYDIEYDHNGFRNDHALTSAEIAVIGDSFVEGALVPSDQLISTVLANIRKSTVVNLGQIGYGPQQELVVLIRYALAFRPKVVVWMFFEGNDLKNVEQYEAIMANWDAYFNSLRSFPDRSFSWNLLQRILPLLGNPKPLGDARMRSGLIKHPDGGVTRMYFEYPGVPVSQRDIRALEKTGSTLASAYAVCVRQGIELNVVFVPTKYRVYNGIAETEPDSEIVNWTVNDLPTRFRETVSGISDDIGYLDLTPLLIEKAEKGAMLYYTDDSHWTPEGHRVAAQAISAYLGR